jgi:hypothetical protein
MNIINITSQQLRRAADIKDEIGKLQMELRAILEPGSIPQPFKGAYATLLKASPAVNGAHKMSPAARARISAGMKASHARRKNKRHTGHKWTPEQRARFKATMKARGFHYAK